MSKVHRAMYSVKLACVVSATLRLSELELADPGDNQHCHRAVNQQYHVPVLAATTEALVVSNTSSVHCALYTLLDVYTKQHEFDGGYM